MLDVLVIYSSYMRVIMLVLVRCFPVRYVPVRVSSYVTFAYNMYPYDTVCTFYVLSFPCDFIPISAGVFGISLPWSLCPNSIHPQMKKADFRLLFHLYMYIYIYIYRNIIRNQKSATYGHLYMYLNLDLIRTPSTHVELDICPYLMFGTLRDSMQHGQGINAQR
jgi:hypothetical protein